MQLQNTFTVPLPTDEAWKVLLDIERVAPCMPGAQLTEVNDKTYNGKVALRLGPVALAFSGAAVFEEVNETAHTARVRAQGTDTKGRGGASAVVTFRLEPIAAGTEVFVDTDLNLSGTIAQYGRAGGIVQHVAADLISQFSQSLKAEIERSGTTPTAAVDGNHGLPPPPQPSQSISGLSLIFRALWKRIVQSFRRGSAAN